MEVFNVSASVARANFSRLVNAVEQGVARVQIVRHGVSLGMLIGPRDQRRLEWLDAVQAKAEEQARARVNAKYGLATPQTAPLTTKQVAQVEQEAMAEVEQELVAARAFELDEQYRRSEFQQGRRPRAVRSG